MKKSTISSLFIAVLLAVPFALFLSVLPARVAHAASGNGHVYGQLLDGSNNNSPLSGQTMTLQTLQGSTGQDFASVNTDSQGRFSFANLPTDKTTTYAVYSNYQGAQYTSDLLTLTNNPSQQVNMLVYDATGNTSKIAIVDTTLLISAPDVKKGTLTISEVFAFKNLDNHAFVGSLDASKGKPNALLFSLPAGVGSDNVTLGKGFSGYQVIVINGGFATNAAVMPGDNEFSFSFNVPYAGSTYNLNYVPFYPTVSLSVLVPPSIEVNTSSLHAQGTTTTADAKQQTVRIFNATGLLANQRLQIGLAGLDTPQLVDSISPFSSLNTQNTWLIIIVVIMLLIVLATWFFTRFRYRRATSAGLDRSQSSGLQTSKAQVSSATSAPKEKLLRELLQLDQAHESGTISEAVYLERRNKAKARLRSLISEQQETSRR